MMKAQSRVEIYKRELQKVFDISQCYRKCFKTIQKRANERGKRTEDRIDNVDDFVYEWERVSSITRSPLKFLYMNPHFSSFLFSL